MYVHGPISTASRISAADALHYNEGGGEKKKELIIGQCCQLFEELFGQSRRKIRPPRKKIRSPNNFKFLKKFGLKKHYFCLCEWGNFLDFPRVRENTRIFLKFGPYCSKLAGRSIFYYRCTTVDTPICCQKKPNKSLLNWIEFFIRPFLTFAAKQSASWQHCSHRTSPYLGVAGERIF